MKWLWKIGTGANSLIAGIIADAASAAMAGGVIAAVDISLSISWSTFARLELPFFLVLFHMALGVGAGVGFALLRAVWDRLGLTAWTRCRPIAAAAIFGATFLAAFVLPLWGYLAYRGLGPSALPWGWVPRLGAGLAAFLPLSRMLRSACPRLLTGLAGASCLVIPTCVALFLSSPPAGASVQPVLDSTMSSKLGLTLVRSLFDRDGDGAPSAFCGRVCDCDDNSSDVNPVAIEIMDNGIDEDCDGFDLRAAELRAIVGDSYVPHAGWRPPPGGTASLPDEPVPGPPATSEQEKTLPTEGRSKTASTDGIKNLRRKYNVVFVLADTVRADHVGCLGYKRNTTPRMDALAEEAVLFTQARSQGSRTPWSFPSMLTGLFHSEIAGEKKSFPRIFDSNIFISEILRDAGYLTWAISSYIYFTPDNGFAQGFDGFDTELHTLRAHIRKKPTSDLVTDRTLDRIDRWRKETNDPFFAFAHYADPHGPYVKHKGFKGFGKSRKERYDGEIQFVDHHVGRLLDGLKERGLDGDTVLIVAADHGEAILEKEDHGVQGHGQNLYDEQIHVPLIIKVPGQKPRVVKEPVGIVDLVPTIVDLTGVPFDGHFSGVSLLPMIRGEEFSHPPVFSEKPYPRRRAQVAMVEWPYKVYWRVAGKSWRLYDLSKDPGEKTDLRKAEPEVFKVLSAKVKLWRSKLDVPKK
jgi:choline-sulfatase